MNRFTVAEVETNKESIKVKSSRTGGREGNDGTSIDRVSSDVDRVSISVEYRLSSTNISRIECEYRYIVSK
jgi:hypothetical protein